MQTALFGPAVKSEGVAMVASQQNINPIPTSLYRSPRSQLHPHQTEREKRRRRSKGRCMCGARTVARGSISTIIRRELVCTTLVRTIICQMFTFHVTEVLQERKSPITRVSTGWIGTRNAMVLFQLSSMILIMQKDLRGLVVMGLEMSQDVWREHMRHETMKKLLYISYESRILRLDREEKTHCHSREEGISHMAAKEGTENGDAL